MTALVQITDVMYAGAEAIAIQREGMSPTARAVMLFEHQHFLAPLCECHCCSQSACA